MELSKFRWASEFELKVEFEHSKSLKITKAKFYKNFLKMIWCSWTSSFINIFSRYQYGKISVTYESCISIKRTCKNQLCSNVTRIITIHCKCSWIRLYKLKQKCTNHCDFASVSFCLYFNFHSVWRSSLSFIMFYSILILLHCCGTGFTTSRSEYQSISK